MRPLLHVLCAGVAAALLLMIPGTKANAATSAGSAVAVVSGTSGPMNTIWG